MQSVSFPQSRIPKIHEKPSPSTHQPFPPDPALQTTMNFKLILGAVLLLVALVFSVQNAAVVDVKIFVWTSSTSLALVIFGALAAGLIGGWAITSALHRKSKGS